MITLEPIYPGAVSADALRLDAALSFWGGIDEASGQIIDQSHPQCGMSVAGKALILPAIRGSGGTPGTLASLIKRGLHPAALILAAAEPNALVGVLIGKKLYARACPIFLADRDTYASLSAARHLTISIDGQVTLGEGTDQG